MRLKFKQGGTDAVIAVTNVHYCKHKVKVSIIGGAGDSGMSAISDNVPQVLAKTIESVKETTGFDLTEVMKANTYDAKVNNNINVATDFGEKITENAVKETTAEMHKNKIPSDSKDECFDYENM